MHDRQHDCPRCGIADSIKRDNELVEMADKLMGQGWYTEQVEGVSIINPWARVSTKTRIWVRRVNLLTGCLGFVFSPKLPVGWQVIGVNPFKSLYYLVTGPFRSVQECKNTRGS